MTTTGERARVERWAVSDPRGEQFWYCSNEQEAKERAANWSKFEHLPYRAFLLREVDPAHDSAVARLCEAARELSRVSLLWVKNCPCGCGSCASTERALEVLDTALSDPALTGAAKGEQEPPAMADQTSGIRCGRCGRSLRERVLDKSGRKCEMCDPRPPMEATHSMNVQPAMPPEGTKVRCWRHKDGFKDGVDRVRWDGVLMWFIRNDAEPRVATLTVKQAEEAVERGSWVECPDAPYIPPTPPQPSGESAEAFAKRLEKNLKVAIEQRDDAQAEAFSLRTRLAAGAGIDGEAQADFIEAAKMNVSRARRAFKDNSETTALDWTIDAMEQIIAALARAGKGENNG